VDGPINLGNPEEISVLRLAQEIIELTNSASEVIRLELPEDDPKQRKPDIQKAMDLLGWKPHISRQDGLLRTIEYFGKLTG
jgi:nucleoside-diphosphate-sugar epimerase